MNQLMEKILNYVYNTVWQQQIYFGGNVKIWIYKIVWMGAVAMATWSDSVKILSVKYNFAFDQWSNNVLYW